MRTQIQTALPSRMQFSVLLCHVALVRTEISKEYSASITRVRGIGELGTLAVTSS
jgi:hypothetical protein